MGSLCRMNEGPGYAVYVPSPVLEVGSDGCLWTRTCLPLHSLSYWETQLLLSPLWELLMERARELVYWFQTLFSLSLSPSGAVASAQVTKFTQHSKTLTALCLYFIPDRLFLSFFLTTWSLKFVDNMNLPSTKLKSAWHAHHTKLNNRIIQLLQFFFSWYAECGITFYVLFVNHRHQSSYVCSVLFSIFVLICVLGFYG